MNRSSPRPDGKSRTSGGPLRLRASPGAERQLRAGHPWLFADSIRSQNRPGLPGDLAVLYDGKDRFLAVGLFDPTSPIRVRILHVGNPRPIDSSFWSAKLESATRLRNSLFDSQTNGFRWINGENDGWPGLVLDRYDTTLVLKLYTAAWLKWLDQIIPVLCAQLQPSRIVLRLSRNIQPQAEASGGRNDGDVLVGATPDAPIIFLEHGLRFEADVLRGQKTGFFLDQRENRRQVANLAQGKSILNAFSFSGGFSVYAAHGGARSVLDLDISAHALAAAKRNFALNESDASVRLCVQEAVQAEAFEWLGTSRPRKFDLIVLDPPSMAKRETQRGGAVQAYERLIRLAIQHLAAKGTLVACSCSAHVSCAEFYEAVRGAARKMRPGFKEIAALGQPPDHPALLPEAHYLKSLYLRW